MRRTDVLLVALAMTSAAVAAFTSGVVYGVAVAVAVLVPVRAWAAFLIHEVQESRREAVSR
jgi:hypothetical protein